MATARKRAAKAEDLYVGDVWAIPDAPYLCSVKTPSNPGTLVSGGHFVVLEPGEYEAWDTESNTFAKVTVRPADERPEPTPESTED
jgi:hypothetical protein